MKNIINITLAVLVLLASTNVYADGGSKKDSKKAKAEKVISKIESTFDKELKLENWMTELKEFSNKEVFVEKELILENWMLENFSDKTESFIEDDLVLENWMTKSFNTEDVFIEEALVLEDWMLDLK